MNLIINEFRNIPVKPNQRVFINFLRDLAELSDCKHGKVAAILVDTDFTTIHAIGVNGCLLPCICGETDAKYGCAHAEQLCLARASYTDRQLIMICTRECCRTCASLIINCGLPVSEFWYIDEYKDHTGINLLERAGIPAIKIIV